MAKPKGFYTDEEKRVRPITGRKPHITPLKKGTSSLKIPKRTVQQIQASRTPRARQIDAKLKAKIAKSEAEWARQPNRRDLKGVDYPKAKIRTQTPLEKEKTDIAWLRQYSLEELVDSENQFIKMTSRFAYNKVVNEKELVKHPKGYSYTYRSERQPWQFQRLSKENGKFYLATFKDGKQVSRKELTPAQFRERLNDFRELQRFGTGKLSRIDFPQQSQAKPRLVRNIHATYNKATGWVALTFDEKPSVEVRQELKSQGFRWRPRRKQWVAKWTTSREDLAKKFAGKVETVDIKPHYAKIAERARELEQKHLRESAERHEIADRISSAIPLGQPILVGHHSEKRHRRDLERIRKNLRKSIEEREIAEKYGEKAERYETLAMKGENPAKIYNRIQRLEANKRNFEHQLILAKIEKKKLGSLQKMGIYPPKDVEWVKRNLKRINQRLDVEQRKYKASGGIPAERMTIKKGKVVRTQFGDATILKVNPKTVRVRFVEKKHAGFQEMKLEKTRILGEVVA